MNWEKIAEVCQRELEQVRSELPDSAAFFPQPERIAETFLNHERDMNEAVEVAVRQFAAERTWPPLSPLERTMLSFRLDFAASLATLLAQQPRPWVDIDDPTQAEPRLRWLLIFAWENEGFSTLHENFSRVLLRTAP